MDLKYSINSLMILMKYLPIMLRNTHTNYTEAYDCSICIKGTVTSISTLVSKLVLSMLNNMFVFNPLQAK